MEKYYTTYSAEETRNVGKQLAQAIAPGTTVCLRGDLGAGKTTLVQGLLEGLGAERPYVSPTFVIMKQYDLKTSSTTGIKRIYHVDAYRVEEKDVATLGFPEWYTDKEGIVLLEWPERVENVIPQNAVYIALTLLTETKRKITIS